MALFDRFLMPLVAMVKSKIRQVVATACPPRLGNPDCGSLGRRRWRCRRSGCYSTLVRKRTRPQQEPFQPRQELCPVVSFGLLTTPLWILAVDRGIALLVQLVVGQAIEWDPCLIPFDSDRGSSRAIGTNMSAMPRHKPANWSIIGGSIFLLKVGENQGR